MKGEILAPCGDFACMEAAVRSGADAVYFGAGNFNARRNANNFEGEAFAKAIAYCRVRGVKTHITLNTLLHDDEIDGALAVARSAAEAGADALIVQDLGLVHRIRHALPNLTLHASTQLTIHDVNGLRAAAELGFARVVLARELSLEEIRTICQEAEKRHIEIEVFVHGALCMSVSGQCYLSAMIGGRSGNRGLCAQPCRLPFSIPGGGGYVLSLKDMSHLAYIPTLMEAGVNSFKIEGRMKPPEYVAAAVTAAREARDTGSVSEKTAHLLQSVFSRSGFTDGYLTGKRQNMFGVRTETDKTMTSTVSNSLHALYRTERMNIPLQAVLKYRIGERAALTLSDGQVSVTAEGSEVRRADGQPLERTLAEHQLCRTGGTPYQVTSLQLEADPDAFAAASELNRLRRTALDTLTHRRELVPPISYQPVPPARAARPHAMNGLTVRFCESLPESLAGITRASLLYTAPDEAFQRLLRETGSAAVELPRTLWGKDDQLRQRLQALQALGVKRALCEHLGAVQLAKELGFQLDGGMFLQLTNSNALAAAKALGLASAVVSFENTVQQSAALETDLEIGLVGYGALPLMIVRCCPLRTVQGCRKGCTGGWITDRMGKRFFVRCRDGASEIFNCVPLVMSDRQRDFQNVDFSMIYFTQETPDEMAAVLKAWKNGAVPASDYTRGLYYRGVQ